MQSLHTLRLPASSAGFSAGPVASLIGRPIAALVDAWRRQRLHRATVETLHALDDRTLRDLGFHRSEIGGIATELGGRTEITYVRARMAHDLRA